MSESRQHTAIAGFKNFEDIRVGDTAEFTHTITERDVQAFANLTGDHNPLHLDSAFAQESGFRQPVVYGMLSASFISTMIGMYIPGKGALWTGQSLQFLNPAYVGDVLTIRAEVAQKSPANRLLVLKIAIENQQGKALITGESTVKMLEIKMKKATPEDGTQTILITGGSRGIGAATAKLLAADGHRIVINYANAEDAASLLIQEITDADGKAIAIRADVSDSEQVSAMIREAESQFGAITAIVHCAASGSALLPFESLEWAHFQRQIDVQLKGAFNCIKAILPDMIAAKSGAIVLLGSIASDNVPPINQSDYVVAKASVSSFAKNLAAELGPKGIRVNTVAPGMTQTAMIAGLPEKARMLAKMQSPLRRLAEPEDIANSIRFLLSPQAQHITGETIRVSGGAVML
ncbi:MAG: SDR family oxidoreductase [Calditrichia bacterium]